MNTNQGKNTRSAKFHLLWFLLLFLYSTASNAQNHINTTDFKNPPQSSRMHTWWHWMDGNITREGITNDLEAMSQNGIVQATIMNIGKIYTTEIDLPKVKFNSPEWTQMFKWALEEANRLDITIGTQTIDGYCTAGGPWITPELSMKQYVWTKTMVEGTGSEISILLPRPLMLENFYRDEAVVAFLKDEKPNSFHRKIPEINKNKVSTGTLLTDANPKTTVDFRKGDVIDLIFDDEFTAGKLVLLPYLPFCWDDMGNITVKFTISRSDDGKAFEKIADVDIVGVNRSISASFPETKARFFRLEMAGTNFMYFANYPVGMLELLEENESTAFVPAVTSFFEKAASVFDVNENVHDLNVNNSENAIDPGSVIDISEFMSSDGNLRWKAPRGQWLILRFGYTSTGVVNHPATPEGLGLEADKMDTTAISVHFNSYAGNLIRAAGKYRGNTFRFILMDSWEAGFQTWTDAFRAEFKNRRGYDILPWIPVLCGETVGSAQLSEAFLHDFRKTIAELIDQNFYKHFRDLCHRNQVEFHGEAIYSNWGAYPPLDPLKANQYPDMPMKEFWADNDINNLAEYIPANRPTPSFPTFSALAYNKQIIGSEAYTNFAHYSEAPFDLKPFGDAAYCTGVNQLILHSFVHQPFDKKPGMTLGKFGAHFNRYNPVWEFSKDWMEYQARVQYVLQKGKPVADVVFFTGDQLPQYFSKSLMHDLPAGIQAAACNIDMLKNATVSDGKISFGGNQEYPLLLLHNSHKMEYSTLQRIAGLVRDGAVVYGPRPGEMLSVHDIKNNSAAFNSLVESLWGNSEENIYGKGKMISGTSLGEVIARLGILPDLTTNTGDPKEIMYIHRRIGRTDVYFLFNQQNKTINREILFRVTGKAPEIWNPENGSVLRPAIFSMEEDHTRIPVSLRPYESMIIVFNDEPPVDFIRQVSLDGRTIFPGLQASDLVPIPLSGYRQDKFVFTGALPGYYEFITGDNKKLATRLSEPEIMDLGNKKTKIEFFPLSDEAILPVEITGLKSLTEFEDPAIKYFTGKARYTINFSASRRFISRGDKIVLYLGGIYETAEVLLNGELLAHPWQPDTGIDITGLLKTQNTLEITVANVCRNRFIGDLVQFGTVKSLWTTSPIETILSADMPLKPAGITGPLRLISYKTVLLALP
jgi:hypothetical protein